MTDDPEGPFRRFPAVLRRWTWRNLNRRLRMPFRRRKWDARHHALTRPYVAEARLAPGVQNGIFCAIGDFSGRTGLSRAGLYELDRLRAEYPDLIVHDIGAALHEGAELPVHEGPAIERLYLLSAPDTYGMLLSCLPPARIRHAYRIGLWVWETPVFPEHWRFAIDLVDEIWTPSEYSRHAIAPAVAPRPVIVRPHAVKAMPPATGRCTALRADFDISDTAFLGLAIMDISSCPARKNPWAHVAAWQRAFGDDPASILLMKIRVSKTTRIVLQELSRMIGTAPNIRIVEAEMTAQDITALQGAADVYLSLHRAEGYGLNIHECLAIGTPVVATDFSANAEYGPRFAGYHPVPFRLVPYRDWTGHYPERNFRWAEADPDEAANILRTLKKQHVLADEG